MKPCASGHGSKPSSARAFHEKTTPEVAFAALEALMGGGAPAPAPPLATRSVAGDTMKSLETLLKIAQRKMDELGIEAARVGTEIADLQMKQARAFTPARKNEVQLGLRRDMQLAAMLPAYRLKVKWQSDQIRAQVNAHESTLVEDPPAPQRRLPGKAKFEQLLEQEALRRAADCADQGTGATGRKSPSTAQAGAEVSTPPPSPTHGHYSTALSFRKARSVYPEPIPHLCSVADHRAKFLPRSEAAGKWIADEVRETMGASRILPDEGRSRSLAVFNNPPRRAQPSTLLRREPRLRRTFPAASLQGRSFAPTTRHSRAERSADPGESEAQRTARARRLKDARVEARA